MVSPLAPAPDGSRAAPVFVIEAHEDNYDLGERFVSSVLGGSLYRSGEKCFAAVFGVESPKVHFFSEPSELSALTSFLTNVEIRRRGERGDYTERANLPIAVAERLLRSPAFHELPILDAVFTSPRAIFDANGTPRLHRRGYEPSTRSMYLPRTTLEVTPSTSTKHLQACVSAMPFRSDADRLRFFGWLLGSFLYDPDILRPLLVVESNSQRAGKSSLCYTAGRIIDGKDPTGLKPGPEFEKRVASLLASSETFGLLDNVVTRSGTFDSSDLSSALTTPGKISIRRLGTNSMISGGGLIFAMSVNEAKLSRDLTTRAVPVSLEVEEGVAKPHRPYAPEYAAAHRQELLNEIFGLALSSPPPAPRLTSRFVAWEQFVRPRIAAAFGDVEMSAEFCESPVDALLLALIAFGIEHLGTPFSLSALADAISNAKNSASIQPIKDALDAAAGERGKTSKLQNAIQRISDGPFLAFGAKFKVVHRKEQHEGRPRSLYTFEEVGA